MTCKKIHFKFYGACISFIPACTLDWCYNTGLFGEDWTEDEEAVTCEKCKSQLDEWSTPEMAAEIEKGLKTAGYQAQAC